MLITYKYLTMAIFGLVFSCLYLRQGLFVSCWCDLFFTIIFIFIIINHIISLNQTQLFFCSSCRLPVKSSAAGCCLAFAYFFFHCQPDVTYINKCVIQLYVRTEPFKIWRNNTIKNLKTMIEKNFIPINSLNKTSLETDE